MDYLSAIIYGLIQGLTEFLPVSSSGHLAILPYFLKIEDPGVFFDLSMHVGTALAVLFYFRVEVSRLLSQTFGLLRGRLEGNAFALNTLISTVVSVILILLCQKLAKEYGRSYSMIAFNLFFFGILMFIADYKGKKDGEIGEMEKRPEYLKAILIGLFQAFAIFPGVSRSGSTLTIARWMGLSREESSRYSFLLSLPIIFGGMSYKLLELNTSQQTFQLESCLIGMLVSFGIGLLAIHSFLKVVGKIGLGYFSVYRVLLALGLIAITIN